MSAPSKEAILGILSETDPLGLIRAGASKDEYLSEAGAIEAKWTDALSVEQMNKLVYDVFVEWFTPEIAGEPNRYTETANRIFELQSASTTRHIDASTFIDWKLKTFDSLSPRELYAILRLRLEVFAVEQNCVYQDADNKDPEAFHLMAWKEGNLLAYTRLLPPFIAFDEASIGRVVTSPSCRRTGLGRQLMEASLAAMHQLYGNIPIRIGAQLYLQKFYESFGFVRVGEIYLEDGIEHVEMLFSRQ